MEGEVSVPSPDMIDPLTQTTPGAATAISLDSSPSNSDGATAQVMTKSTNEISDKTCSSTPSVRPKKPDPVMRSNMLFIEQLPSSFDYEAVNSLFTKNGPAIEIRMSWLERSQAWNAWVKFSNFEIAMQALNEIEGREINGKTIKVKVTDSIPKNLDVYRPAEWTSQSQNDPEMDQNYSRNPKTPRWIIATVKGERCNFLLTSRYLQRKVGNIDRNDISRFGRKAILIHAKSDNQAIMLLNMKLEQDSMLKEVKPHFAFSYAKGIVFDQDLHEFSNSEILAMSPHSVWKVFKVPRTKSMIVVTFVDDNLPSYLYFEGLRLSVRPYKQRPMQCYNCFGFYHAAEKCTREKICGTCSGPAHEECTLPAHCINCSGNHKPISKECPYYKREEEALCKANNEHISVGHARMLLKDNGNYAAAAAKVIDKTTPPSRKQPSASNITESVSTPSGSVACNQTKIGATNIQNHDSQSEPKPKLKGRSNSSPSRSKRCRTPSSSPLGTRSSSHCPEKRPEDQYREDTLPVPSEKLNGKPDAKRANTGDNHIKDKRKGGKYDKNVGNKDSSKPTLSRPTNLSGNSARPRKGNK